MDSGNSGSMQSSSTGGGGGGGGGGGSGCGDEQEYDSRGGGGGESISAFFNPVSSFNINNMGAAPLQLYSFSNGSSSFAGAHHHHHHHQVSNYFDRPPPTLSQSSSLECPNFMLNHNNNDNNNGTSNNNNSDNNNNQVDMVWPNKFASIRPSVSTDDANCTGGPLGYSISNNNNHQQQNPPSPLTHSLPAPGPPPPPVSSPLSSSAPTITGSGRNPKKRSRASRRAPTTVLTTDTSNFRQMVQEFTGIPAPPFTAFSTRGRFDLFSGLGGLSSSAVPPPTYLLRPFPQKIPPLHQPPFLATSSLPSHNTTTTIHNSSALVDGLMSAEVAAAASSAATSISTTIAAAQASTNNFHLCDPQEFLSTNPQLNFQSLLQPTSSSSLADQHDSSMTLGCTSVTGTTPTPHQISCSVDLAGGNYRGISTTAAAVNGASDINGGATKGEGMVDSWICSSD